MILDARAIVVANGDVPDAAALDAAWPGWRDSVAFVVAADGGALRSKRLALRPDLIVGDADSIDAASLEQYRDDGVEVRLLPAAKDASDTELALGAAFERGATAVTLLGALGGLRLDHALANVGLLARNGFAGRPIELLDASCRVSLVRGDPVASGPVRRSLAGPIGGLVSLLPVGDGTTGVSTVGLLYPLRDEPLPAGTTRGLSNVRIAPEAEVSLRTGLLLVVEGSGSQRPVTTLGRDPSTETLPTGVAT